MAASNRSLSLGILGLAFILGVYVNIQSMRIVNEMDYSAVGIPLWKGPFADVPENYRVYLNLVGRLSAVKYPDLGSGNEDNSEQSDVMIFETTNSGDIRVPRVVYLTDEESSTGLIPTETGFGLAYSAAGSIIRKSTFIKLVQALYEGWTIEAEGYAFDVMQGGRRLTLFDVERFVSAQKGEALKMYKKVCVSSNTLGTYGVSGVPRPLPVRFEVGRTYRDVYWTESEYYYGLWMDAGETIRYIFEGDRPVHFRLLYSNCTSFVDWTPESVLVEEPSITTQNEYFTAEWDGFYIFGFEGGDPASRVAFNALRKTGEAVLMPAWILGGRTGGGSGVHVPVNGSDLSQFPHLLEAFEEDARATAVHADHMTYCPASEAIRMIEFFGEEYTQGIDWYGFKLVLEDGSIYSF